VNLALSLLSAAERHPEAEALPGLGYAALRDRAARIAGGLGLERGERLAVVLDNRVETAVLYWAAQWAGAVFVPLSWRLSEAELDYCVEDCGARLVLREDDSIPEGAQHPGALDLDEREPSLMLYTSGTTGKPKGVPRSHGADRAGGLSQSLQHGYLPGDRTLGVMPLYHTMGIHSLVAMHLVGGCFVSLARWDASEALRLIEQERITSLYLAPTLFHDLVHHPDAGQRDLSSVRALRPNWLGPNGSMRSLVQFARATRHPEFPDVPTARELALSDKARALIEFAELPYRMSRPFVAPPNLPADRAKALQAGFLAVHKDPRYLEEAAKLRIEVSPIGADDVLKAIDQIAAAPPDILDQMRKLFASSKSGG